MTDNFENNLIIEATKYIEKLFEGNADGHDYQHSLRVYKNATRILADYPDADSLTVYLAAILHDVDDHKLFHHENNENARGFLSGQNVKVETIEKICGIINEVSFSKNRGKKPSSIESCIVQDADRLDALGAVGVARTFAYGGKNGRSLEDSIQHFYEKLLLLKGELNTPAATKMAEERHRFLEEFLEEWSKETK